MFGDLEQDMRHRPAWIAVEGHTGLFWSTVTFLDIASEAGGGDIVPAVKATTRTRNNMVDGQIVPLITAILASVIVAMQDIAAGKRDLLVRDLDVGPESDDRRQRHIGIYDFAIVLDLLGLALHEEHYRTSPRADIERLV